jgi:hypothetical protein
MVIIKLFTHESKQILTNHVVTLVHLVLVEVLEASEFALVSSLYHYWRRVPLLVISPVW